MNLFGMITTPGSQQYTALALESFFSQTTLGPDDRFVLVDNDPEFVWPGGVPAGRVTVIRPAERQGFARHANALLAEARTAHADLFLLNNDLVFTPNWLEPLCGDRRSLLSATSNAHAGQQGAATHQGYQTTSSVPFFCIKIPRRVYEVVGEFDEQLDTRGAEDSDYAVRAWIAGIPVELAVDSHVLQFQGRSTPLAGEAFQKKWGASLTHAFLRGDFSPFLSNATLAQRIEQQQFTPVVRHLRSNPSLPSTALGAGPSLRATPSESTHPIEMYLDLLEAALLNTLYEDPSMDPWSGRQFDPEKRRLGRDWPSQAHTMIGQLRMRQLRAAVVTAIRDGVPGDLIETGVWRGGACVYMAGILRALEQQERKVWVADSFAGLPPPDPEKYPADAGDQHHTMAPLAVSLDEVRATFARYGLLGDNVSFLKGWFSETLPSAPIERIAVLRLDGDMYGSTWDALEALYPKLSPGGYCIVDDFGAVEGCKKAVLDYRERFGITEPIQPIDGLGVYWRRCLP